MRSKRGRKITFGLTFVDMYTIHSDDATMGIFFTLGKQYAHIQGMTIHENDAIGVQTTTGRRE